jgi:glycosyltransferase involved in cell wall biosynthesis
MKPRPGEAHRSGTTAPRLCMVLHGPYPLAEPRATREARVALERGFAVDVVAMRNRDEPAVEMVEGVRVLRLPLSHKWGRGLLGVMAEYLGFTALATAVVAVLAVRRRQAVVHVHSPPDFLVLAAVLPKLLGARVILDIHDLAPDMFAMRFAERSWLKPANRVLRMVERTAAWFADSVITAQEPFRRELAARGIDEDKIIVVLNSLDEQLLPPTMDAPPSPGFHVVYHGTLTPHYGVDLIVEAAAKVAGDIPDLRVSIFGDGDALPAIRSRSAALQLTDRVELSGRFLPQSEVLERVQSASVGVVPTLDIPRNALAFPTKLFEYVALGIPVVASDLSAVREYFSEEEICYFRPGDAEALATALRTVAQNPGEAAGRAAAALRRYEHYRWSIHASRYARVLTGSLSERQR